MAVLPLSTVDVEQRCVSLADQMRKLLRVASSGETTARRDTATGTLAVLDLLRDLLITGHLTPGGARTTDPMSLLAVEILIEVYEGVLASTVDQTQFRSFRRGLIRPDGVADALARSGVDAVFELLLLRDYQRRGHDWPAVQLNKRGVDSRVVADSHSAVYAVATRRNLTPSVWESYDLSIHDASVLRRMAGEGLVLDRQSMGWFGEPGWARSFTLEHLGVLDGLAGNERETVLSLADEWGSSVGELVTSARLLCR